MEAAPRGAIWLLQSLHALAPQPARNAAEAALHDADDVHVFNAGATAVVDNVARRSGRADRGQPQRSSCSRSLPRLNVSS